MVWLESSEPTADEVGDIGGLSFLKIVVCSGWYVDFLHRMLITCPHFSHLKIGILICICILICFMNDAWIFPIELCSIWSVLCRFWPFRILLVFFTNLSDFPVYLTVHVVVFVMYWIQRLVVGTDSASYCVPLVVTVQLSPLCILIITICQIHVYWWHALNCSNWTSSVLLLVNVRWEMMLTNILVPSIRLNIPHYTLVHLWVLCCIWLDVLISCIQL